MYVSKDGLCKNGLHVKNYKGKCSPCRAALHKRWRYRHPEVWKKCHARASRMAYWRNKEARA